MKISEFEISSFIALIGTALTTRLGGWDAILQALVIFIILDYITGILAAAKQKRLNSDVMFWGLIRKAVIFAVIIVAVVLDNLTHSGEHVFRTLVLYFYIVREALSITENCGKLGLPLPVQLLERLEQLKEKGGKEK